MKLKKKLSIFTSLFLVIGLFTSVYIYYETARLSDFYKETLRNESINLINISLEMLSSNHKKTIYDYTNWDEMANFVQNPSKQWAIENLDEGLIKGMSYEFIKIFNTQKQSIITLDLLGFESQLSEKMLKLDSAQIKEFYVLYKDKLVNVFITTINSSFDSKKTGAKFGYVIIANLIDEESLHTIEKLSKCKISIQKYFDKNTSKDLTTALPLKNFNGGNAGYFVIEPELTDVSERFINLSENMPIIYMLIMLSFSLFVIWLIYKKISKPLETVHSLLLEMNTNVNLSYNPDDDEISQLQLTAQALSTQKKELDLITQRLKLATQNAKIRIWDYDIVSGDIALQDLLSEDDIPEILTMDFMEWKDLIFQEDRNDYIHSLSNSISEKRNFEAYFRISLKSGDVKYYKTYANLFLKDKKPVRLTGINIDYTTEKKYEKEILHSRDEAAKANKVKSEFIANFSHEIRTPINSILGFSDILLQTPLDQKQLGSIKSIKKAGSSLLDLINDILDISKISSGKIEIHKESFSLRELLNEVVEMFIPQIRSKNLEFSINFSDDFPLLIVSDKMYIRQILFNLLGNAVKFTFRGGVSVNVTTKLIDKLSKKISFTIAIHDTGIGIEANEIETIFDEFERAESKQRNGIEGTGLGLTIVKKLVNLIGGMIKVESEPSKGTTFTVSFFEVDYVQGETGDISFVTVNIYDDNDFVIVKDDFDGKENLFPILYNELYTQCKKLTEYTSISNLNELIDNIEDLGKENSIHSLVSLSAEMRTYLTEFDFGKISVLLNKLITFLEEIKGGYANGK